MQPRSSVTNPGPTLDARPTIPDAILGPRLVAIGRRLDPARLAEVSVPLPEAAPTAVVPPATEAPAVPAAQAPKASEVGPRAQFGAEAGQDVRAPAPPPAVAEQARPGTVKAKKAEMARPAPSLAAPDQPLVRQAGFRAQI